MANREGTRLAYDQVEIQTREVTVTLDEEEVSEAIQEAALWLIGKLWGSVVPMSYLTSKLSFVWAPVVGSIRFVVMGNGFFTIKCSKEEDYLKIRNGGPWMVGGKYFIVMEWQPNFHPYDFKVERAKVWIRIPCLPMEYWTAKIMSKLVAKIGKFLYMDELTEKRAWGEFAKVCVEVKLEKPLIHEMVVIVRGEEHRYNIYYDGLSECCYWCGKLGHKIVDCRDLPFADLRPELEGGLESGDEGRNEEWKEGIEEEGFFNTTSKSWSQVLKWGERDTSNEEWKEGIEEEGFFNTSCKSWSQVLKCGERDKSNEEWKEGIEEEGFFNATSTSWSQVLEWGRPSTYQSTGRGGRRGRIGGDRIPGAAKRRRLAVMEEEMVQLSKTHIMGTRGEEGEAHAYYENQAQVNALTEAKEKLTELNAEKGVNGDEEEAEPEDKEPEYEDFDPDEEFTLHSSYNCCYCFYNQLN